MITSKTINPVRNNTQLASSLCHGAGGYHPSTRQRIAGRRLCTSWRQALRALAPDDVEL
jgi:hypothetical protein